MKQSKIDRINELARLAGQRELTDQEQRERAGLRREYIDNIKAGLAAQLENTYLVDETGQKRKLQKKK